VKVPANFPDRKVCIIGLGYVGLTLAVAMAEAGFEVIGVERDQRILKALDNGHAHFSEVGLNPRLAAQLAAKRLRASRDWPKRGANDVYIITVGTPLAAGGATNLDAIRAVSEDLARILSPGDLVVLRSTVRVGVSRSVVKPVLDRAGVAYSLAFCPERTLEGKALIELRTLPQIVGGIDEASAIRASQMFNFVTPTTIRVRDLETAEMIKLINNTQRDLMFAFANEVAGMCDAIGVSAVEVIRAGNMGYARGFMPMPGPVGGPCLEKDAHILAEGVRFHGGEARMTELARTINEELPARVVEIVSEALDGTDIKKIAVAGLAFKGRPETSDLRGTLAIPLIAGLKARYPRARIVGFDPAVSPVDIMALGIDSAEAADDAFQDADGVIFQNNNARFEHLDLAILSELMRPDAVIYDLWNQFDIDTLTLRSDVRYFGLGTRTLVGVARRDDRSSNRIAVAGV
jgi:UDP-N-acetyl-D-mannosaminuronic acid dehydrogenase